jgi:hypothetical protein
VTVYVEPVILPETRPATALSLEEIAALVYEAAETYAKALRFVTMRTIEMEVEAEERLTQAEEELRQDRVLREHMMVREEAFLVGTLVPTSPTSTTEELPTTASNDPVFSHFLTDCALDKHLGADGINAIPYDLCMEIGGADALDEDRELLLPNVHTDLVREGGHGDAVGPEVVPDRTVRQDVAERRVVSRGCWQSLRCSQ